MVPLPILYVDIAPYSSRGPMYIPIYGGERKPPWYCHPSPAAPKEVMSHYNPIYIYNIHPFISHEITIQSLLLMQTDPMTSEFLIVKPWWSHVFSPKKLCKCQDFQGENGLDLDAFREIVNDGASAQRKMGSFTGFIGHRCHRYI